MSTQHYYWGYRYQYIAADGDDGKTDWCNKRFGWSGARNKTWEWYYGSGNAIVFVFSKETDYAEFVLRFG